MRLLVPALPFTAFMSRLAGICFYLLLAALLTILPLRAFAQEERTAEKAAAEKARREAAAKQQASPEPAKQADETSSEKKSEDVGLSPRVECRSSRAGQARPSRP